MIAIVDYRAGNLTSVRLGFEALHADAQVTSRPEEILAADRVVFPGVGAAGAAMQALGDLGIIPALTSVVARGTPFLGICLGTQVIFSDSEEDGGVKGIGLLAGRVCLFDPPDPMTKVPHMGWNRVKQVRPHPLFEGIEDESEFFFVHSYYPEPADRSLTLAETDYAGVRFASVVGRGNLIAAQFHPEKSGRIGLQFLRNFAGWDGKC